jgi:hypothetical protein
MSIFYRRFLSSSASSPVWLSLPQTLSSKLAAILRWAIIRGLSSARSAPRGRFVLPALPLSEDEGDTAAPATLPIRIVRHGYR